MNDTSSEHMQAPLPRISAVPYAFRIFLLVSLSLLMQPSLLRAQQQIPISEEIEWTWAVRPQLADPKLPNVLLLGDSITRSYFPRVSKDLSGIANVYLMASSTSVGDPRLPNQIAEFAALQRVSFAVVHFNNGLHGWGYTERQFKSGFPIFLEAIRALPGHPRLIWTTITPVKPEAPNGATNPRIESRNAIARALVEPEKILIDDLHALMTQHSDLYEDPFHFNNAGAAIMGDQAATIIRKALEDSGHAQVGPHYYRDHSRDLVVTPACNDISHGDPVMPNPPIAQTIDSRIAAAMQTVRQPQPKRVRPIMVIGAGGIVRAAHLPAYEKAGFPVAGLMDQDADKAAVLAAERRISHVFGSIAEAVRFAPPDAVFDVAVPASQLIHILPQLPKNATVLIQKPMGETLEEARIIRDLCREKNFTAAVNFSLRYSPNNLAVAALANGGLLGDIHDIEVQTSTYTPWHLWIFLAAAPRLEILYHSIHYFDLIRSWLGNPQSVYARTVKNPHSAHLAATKTIAILDYGNAKRVFVATNHNHNFGPDHQHSFVQWEGLNGAARITMGVNLDYPKGKPDTAEYAERGSDSPCWRSVPVSGNNFPDAFMGTMGALQCFAEGSASALPSHFEDAFQTMALVEALYRSSEQPGEPLPLDG